MKLSSVYVIEIATFKAQDYERMYHMPKIVITMVTPFSIPNRNSNSRDIFKNWVKEPAKFRTTPS